MNELWVSKTRKKTRKGENVQVRYTLGIKVLDPLPVFAIIRLQLPGSRLLEVGSVDA